MELFVLRHYTVLTLFEEKPISHHLEYFIEYIPDMCSGHVICWLIRYFYSFNCHPTFSCSVRHICPLMESSSMTVRAFCFIVHCLLLTAFSHNEVPLTLPDSSTPITSPHRLLLTTFSDIWIHHWMALPLLVPHCFLFLKSRNAYFFWRRVYSFSTSQHLYTSCLALLLFLRALCVFRVLGALELKQFLAYNFSETFA